MIIRSPSSRSARISLHARSALPIIVPPIHCGTFSGFMNGGAQRIADGSPVNGTQCSTLLPKKVRPKASPFRISRKWSIAFIEASYRVPSPKGVIMLLETSTQNSILVSTRLVLGALNC